MNEFCIDDLKDDHELKLLLNEPSTRALMALRCAEQGHNYENCCSVFFNVYQQCKWCGEKR